MRKTLLALCLLLMGIPSTEVRAEDLSAAGREFELLRRGMENEAFNLARSMTVALAMCELTAEERRATEGWRIAGMTVAAEQMGESVKTVRKSVSEFAAKVASKLITDGHKEASCAYHRAWLLQ